MSDKFFFKGRQDARQSHVGGGYNTKASQKAGTEKFPLSLTVTDETRKKEVETLVAEAGLYAEITIDCADGAVESLVEFEAMINTGSTVNIEKTPARNDPCSCGSGKKYKKCCG